LSDALHERLDKLGEQLERACDEAEQAYLDLAEQQQARREEFRAMALEYQRGWQELSEKAIRYCAGRAGFAAAPADHDRRSTRAWYGQQSERASSSQRVAPGGLIQNDSGLPQGPAGASGAS
jgi:hypothetical protein